MLTDAAKRLSLGCERHYFASKAFPNNSVQVPCFSFTYTAILADWRNGIPKDRLFPRTGSNSPVRNTEQTFLAWLQLVDRELDKTCGCGFLNLFNPPWLEWFLANYTPEGAVRKCLENGGLG